MPTPTKGPRLGGGPAHERLMLANLAAALFEHKRITTTVTKAKRLKPYAERLVTFAKRGDLASRRRVLGLISNKGVVHELFTDIARRSGEPRWWLHPHHQDRQPQGRQRSHGCHRTGPRAGFRRSRPLLPRQPRLLSAMQTRLLRLPRKPRRRGR